MTITLEKNGMADNKKSLSYLFAWVLIQVGSELLGVESSGDDGLQIG